MVDTDQGGEGGSTLRPRQESKKMARRKRLTVTPKSSRETQQSLTPSPAPSAAASSRSAAASTAAVAGSTTAAAASAVPTSPTAAAPVDDFWRLLPVGQKSRRNSSAATDGPARAGRAPSWLESTPSSESAAKESPLTPFPPLRAGSSDGEAEGAPGALSQQDSTTPAIKLGPTRFRPGRNRWTVNTTTHGAVLVGQCVVILTVFSGFLYCSIVDEGKVDFKDEAMPWKYVDMGLGIMLATCVGVLALHETRVLSTVAILYFQALIIVLTMATSLAMWILIFTHSVSQVVKGAVVSGVVMLMGMAMLAFFRAALVWWLLEEQGELGRSGGEDEDEDVGEY
ncbi:hypothetical protein CP533_5380 [Ophiocordyceps camponoti-saundersi (nom. inval.)]|nr:hypothetical protein CP533_5380 [Ophiocordyceps camponoti-saundersi (nom. inval.)]